MLGMNQFLSSSLKPAKLKAEFKQQQFVLVQQYVEDKICVYLPEPKVEQELTVPKTLQSIRVENQISQRKFHFKLDTSFAVANSTNQSPASDLFCIPLKFSESVSEQ